MAGDDHEVDSPTKLQRHLRFSIAEMGELNSHHEFEHLCRAIAKARVASNILPATGPVSGGGDQGRDFETFATYISSDEFEPSAFAALASADRIVFVCTLQTEKISTKVLADISAITSQGAPVDKVYAFLGQSYSKAKRSTLQKQVLERHGLPLEVFDRHAIADFLSDHDLYWAAVEYLHMSTSMQPPPPTPSTQGLPYWYESERERWQIGTGSVAVPETFADLESLRSGLNLALFDRNARRDLAHWARALEPLTESDLDKVRQLARYSIAVARYRGGADIDGDSAAIDFFSDLPAMYDPGLLEDCGVLLSYLFTAIRLGLSNIETARAEEWRVQMIERCLSLKAMSPGPNNTAALLRPAALQCISIDTLRIAPAGNDSAGHQTPEPPAAHASDIQVDIDVSQYPLYDPGRGLQLLIDLIGVLPEATLFPVETVAEIFDHMTPALIDLPGFEEVRVGLDDAVARNAGKAAAASRARDRGMRLLRSNRLLEALREMHEAKSKWWTDQTLEGSILALLIISRIYYGLRLVWAAKMYALAASSVALNSGKPSFMYLVPRGFLMAAECEANCGAWLSSAETMKSAILFHSQLSPDPWDTERHEFYAAALKTHFAIFRYTGACAPTLHSYLREQYEAAGLLHIFIELQDETDGSDPTVVSDFLSSMIENFSGLAVSDAGPEKRADWTYRGLGWTVKWPNNESAELLADRFITVGQILLAEIAKLDVVPLLKGVQVRIEAKGDVEEDSVVFEEVDLKGRGHWKVRLEPYSYDPSPTTDRYMELAADSAAAVLSIVTDLSTRPPGELQSVLTDALSAGLATKLVAGRPNDELISYKESEFWQRAQVVQGESLIDSRGADNPELPAERTGGPGYSKDAARHMVQARYDNISRLLPITIQRVLEDATSRSVLRELREQGWLDWHLLTALSNLTLNFRINSDEMDEESWAERARRVEDENDPPLPLEWVQPNRMVEMLEVSSLHTLQGWGLQVNIDGFPGWLVLDLLRDRYDLNEDVEHEPLQL